MKSIHIHRKSIFKDPINYFNVVGYSIEYQIDLIKLTITTNKHERIIYLNRDDTSAIIIKEKI